jgi:HpcH/HpaI aldolase/citrate lyase family
MVPGFKQRLRAGTRYYGAMVTLPTASTAEILVDAGFQWLFIDGEHGPLSLSEILGILQAVGHRVPCLVRVPILGEAEIKQVLDLGAQGVIVPQVNSPGQAADVVRYARYAPEGGRGVGLARAHGYGFQFAEYIASANAEVCVIVQAEHRLAVENIEEIVRVAGVDGVIRQLRKNGAGFGSGNRGCHSPSGAGLPRSGIAAGFLRRDGGRHPNVCRTGLSAVVLQCGHAVSGQRGSPDAERRPRRWLTVC